MSCKTIDLLSNSAEFSVEIDETGLPAVEYTEYPCVEKKKKTKNKNGHTYPDSGSVTEKTAEKKGSLTLLFESAENGRGTTGCGSQNNVTSSLDDEPPVQEPEILQSMPAEDLCTGTVEECDSVSDIYSYSDYRRCFRSSGIVYDVAEEIYRRERTRAEIEALEQPPFRKVFDRDTLKSLNAQAEEQTRKLYSVKYHPVSSEEHPEAETEPEQPKRGFNTVKALALQILFLIPLVNIFSAMALSFGSNTDKCVRAYARGYMIISSVFISAALGYVIFNTLSNPDNDFISKLISLFENAAA